MHRRGFFGWLLGGAASAAVPPKEPITEQKVVSLPEGWKVNPDSVTIKIAVYECHSNGKTTTKPLSTNTK